MFNPHTDLAPGGVLDDHWMAVDYNAAYRARAERRDSRGDQSNSVCTENLVKEIARLQQAAVFTEEVLGQRLYHRPLSWGNPPDQNLGEYMNKARAMSVEPPTVCQMCLILGRMSRFE